MGKYRPFLIGYHQHLVEWKSCIHYSTDFKYQELEVNDPVPTAHWKKKFKKLLELSGLNNIKEGGPFPIRRHQLLVG
jgi:hypothetical protein